MADLVVQESSPPTDGALFHGEEPAPAIEPDALSEGLEGETEAARSDLPVGCDRGGGRAGVVVVLPPLAAPAHVGGRSRPVPRGAVRILRVPRTRPARGHIERGCGTDFRRRARGRDSHRAVRAPHAGDDECIARRVGRRDRVLEVRAPAARRRVQVPRRDERRAVTRRLGCCARRRRPLVGESRGCTGARSGHARHPGLHRDARRRARGQEGRGRPTRRDDHVLREHAGGTRGNTGGGRCSHRRNRDPSVRQRSGDRRRGHRRVGTAGSRTRSRRRDGAGRWRRLAVGDVDRDARCTSRRASDRRGTRAGRRRGALAGEWRAPTAAPADHDRRRLADGAVGTHVRRDPRTRRTDRHRRRGRDRSRRWSSSGSARSR